jgi:CNP1-like family
MLPANIFHRFALSIAKTTQLLRAQIWLFALPVALWAGSAGAQLAASDPNWKESDAPAAPAFELKRLVPFDVSLQSELRWGFDPVAMQITGDGIVRYVVVAQSGSGVMNVMYEGFRCATGQWKTYARFRPESGWTSVVNPQWIDLRGQNRHHAMRLAQQGMCTGAAPASNVSDVVRSVRQ